MSLFGDAVVSLPAPQLRELSAWSHEAKIEQEFAAIGFYLSGHPIDEHKDKLRERGAVEIAKLPELVTGRTKAHIIAGVITAVRRRRSQRGSQYAFVEISDSTATAEITVFAEEVAAAGDRLQPGTKVLVVVEAKAEGEKLNLRASVLEFLEDEAQPECRGLRVFFDSADAPAKLQELLESNLADGDGMPRGAIRFCPVSATLSVDADIEIQGLFPVNDRIRRAIASLDGIVKVEPF